jgi:hypothetical protein
MALSYTSWQVLQRNNRGTQFCWFLLFFPSGIWLSTELVVLEVVCLILSSLHGASCLMWIAERSLNSNLQQRWSLSAGRYIDVQDFMKFVSGLVFVGPWAAEDVSSPFISPNLSSHGQQLNSVHDFHGGDSTFCMHYFWCIDQ